jgi:hypothetical protein
MYMHSRRLGSPARETYGAWLELASAARPGPQAQAQAPGGQRTRRKAMAPASAIGPVGQPATPLRMAGRAG